MRDDCIRIFCISFCANLRTGTKLLVLGRDIEKRIRISGGSNSSQCQYVKWGKNSSSCANVTGDLSTDVRRALSSAGIRNTGSMINSAASTATISGQINNSKPLMVRWGWDSGGGHMLVIRGYTSDPGYLVVSYIDPLQSYYSSGTYDWMKSGSGHTWTHTRYGFSR